MVANLLSDPPSYEASARFVIGGSNSSSVTVSGSSYTWTSEATLDVSAKSGWYTMAIQLQGEQASVDANIKGYTIVYKQA